MADKPTKNDLLVRVAAIEKAQRQHTDQVGQVHIKLSGDLHSHEVAVAVSTMALRADIEALFKGEPPAPGEPELVWSTLDDTWDADPMALFPAGQWESPLADWTVRFWLLPWESTGTVGVMCIGEGDDGSFQARIDAYGGKTKLRLRGAGTRLAESEPIALDAPIHVAVVAQNGNAFAYVSNQQVIDLGPCGALWPETIVLGALYGYQPEIKDPMRGALHKVEVYRGAVKAGQINEWEREAVPPPPLEPDVPEPPVPPPVEPPHPNGDPPSTLPPTGGRVVRVSNQTELMAAWVARQAKDHIVFAAGNYGNAQLIDPRDAMRLEADGPVSCDGAYGQPHFLSGIADDVSMLGPWTLRRYGPATGGLDADGRLSKTTGETGVILADRKWPAYSKAWVLIGVSVVDCPRREGARLKGSGHEVHSGTFRNLSSVGIAMNNCEGGRISTTTFRDINTAGAASHHHSGAIKCLGGRKDEGAQGQGWPASKGVEIWKCEAYNLINCRGLLWADWDNDGFLIEDCLVDGVDFEAVAIEASARFKVVRLTAKDTNRRRHNNVGMWNAAVMFQNSKECEVSESTFHHGNGLAVVGVQNWNRQIGDSYIGEALGQYNWVHDSKIVGSPPQTWHLGNGGPVRPDRPAPHPEAKKLLYCNWTGPNFG